MTSSILSSIQQQIQDAVADARAAAAGVGRDAIMLAESASLATGEPKPSPVRSIARDLRNRSGHVALGAIESAVAAARLDAFAACLQIVEDERDAKALLARQRIEAEAARDAEAYVRDAEDEPADEYAAGAFDAWYADEDDSVIGPLTVGEARDCYVAAFLRALRVLGGAS